MVREKYRFDKEDSVFKMHTFQASRDLSEKHDEIYDEKNMKQNTDCTDDADKHGFCSSLYQQH